MKSQSSAPSQLDGKKQGTFQALLPHQSVGTWMLMIKNHRKRYMHPQGTKRQQGRPEDRNHHPEFPSGTFGHHFFAQLRFDLKKPRSNIVTWSVCLFLGNLLTQAASSKKTKVNKSLGSLKYHEEIPKSYKSDSHHTELQFLSSISNLFKKTYKA